MAKYKTNEVAELVKNLKAIIEEELMPNSKNIVVSDYSRLNDTLLEAGRFLKESEEADEEDSEWIHCSWHVDDIKSRDEDDELTEDECREILHWMKRKHDANIGINWDVIDCYIDMFKREREEKS